MSLMHFARQKVKYYKWFLAQENACDSLNKANFKLYE